MLKVNFWIPFFAEKDIWDAMLAKHVKNHTLETLHVTRPQEDTWRDLKELRLKCY